MMGLYNSTKGELLSWFTAAAEEESSIEFQAQVFTLLSVRHGLLPDFNQVGLQNVWQQSKNKNHVTIDIVILLWSNNDAGD